MPSFPHVRIGRVLAGLAAAVAGIAAVAAPTYRVTDLGVPAGYDGATPVDINDRGEVLGLLIDPAEPAGIPFTWTAADGMRFGKPARRSVHRTLGALGNFGQVVGWIDCHACDHREALWWKSRLANRELPGLYEGASAEASGINGNSTVVGSSYYMPGYWHVVTWNYPARVDRTPGLADAKGAAINDNGQITGWMRRDVHDARHAMRVDRDGHVTDLGTFPGGSYSFGRAINAAGTIVGAGDDEGSRPAGRKPFVWTSATGLRDMAAGSAFEGLEGEPTDIDDDGQAVGTIGTRAFWWSEADGMRALDDLVDPADPLSGQIALDGYARINESGVVAVGGTMGGVPHVFVLAPAP